MRYREAMEYMEGLRSYGIVPGLDSIRELCGRLGNPQERLKVVHVAGTNGKGSVTAYVAEILKCAGYRTGRYLSPAVVEYREIIQVNGRNISQAAYCEGLELIKNICYEMQEEGLPHPTPFEVETMLAFWYFEKKGCDIVVMETGMGGRLDATNVVNHTLVAVLAPISMDHMKFLGGTLAQIAAEKAGILKAGCAVVSAQQDAEAMEVVRDTAKKMGCELRMVGAENIQHLRNVGGGRKGIGHWRFDYCGADGAVIKGIEISLAGMVQPGNAALAIEVVRALAEKGIAVKEEILRKGLRETLLKGRFGVIGNSPLFVADGAHNEDAARKLAQSIEFYFTNRRITYIMGMLRDKEYEKVIRLTHQYAEQIITITPPAGSRALTAFELASEIAKVHPQVTAADSLEEAVEMARLVSGPEDVILAFGSLSYLGELIKVVEGRREGK